MKKTFHLLLLSVLTTGLFAQTAPVACNLSGREQLLAKNNNVFEKWEYKVDKKSKKKVFNSLCAYNENGCTIKQMEPQPGNYGTISLKEWSYDATGRLASYKEGKVDADSAKSYSFSNTFSYTFTGLVSTYRKEIYEGEMSQTVEKWEYSYSDKGQRTSSSFTRLLVRKDTISNDEIKYSGNGTPLERSINIYFPKGISTFRKYNTKGLPLEFIRYEKGKIVSHKIYSYQYNAQGMLELETATDGVGKINEKKKYEKDKIVYTLMNSKGVVLKNSSEPLTPPVTQPYPVLPAADAMAPVEEKKDNTVVKERLDKKKNKVEDHYNGSKLSYSDTFNPQGLVIERSPAEEGFTLIYEYTFF